MGAGALIGYSVTTGVLTGPHLHHEERNAAGGYQTADTWAPCDGPTPVTYTGMQNCKNTSDGLADYCRVVGVNNFLPSHVSRLPATGSGCRDYDSKYEHPCHISPTANPHDAIELALADERAMSGHALRER